MKTPKFYYYSAHDVTLNALLAAFDLMKEQEMKWPIYGANLILEVYKSQELNDPNFSIKVYYCEKVSWNYSKSLLKLQKFPIKKTKINPKNGKI